MTQMPTIFCFVYQIIYTEAKEIVGFCFLSLLMLHHFCFIHSIFSSFGFWYFGHFSFVIFFPFFPVLPILPCKMQTKIIIFSYFRNFVTKSDQKPKTKNGTNETF